MRCAHLAVIVLPWFAACAVDTAAAASVVDEAKTSRAVVESLISGDAKKRAWTGSSPAAEACPIAVDETTRATATNVESVLRSRLGDLDRLIATPLELLSTPQRLDAARKELAATQTPVVLYVPLKVDPPRLTGGGFTPGHESGQLVVFDIEADRVACVASIEVTNNASVEFGLTEAEGHSITQGKLELTDLRTPAELETRLNADLRGQVAEASKSATFQRVP
jgi:hypothetical protein